MTGADHVEKAAAKLEQVHIAGKSEEPTITSLYASYDKRWPHRGGMWKQNLALAGFEYTGKSLCYNKQKHE